jgi:hypothetical protein
MKIPDYEFRPNKVDEGTLRIFDDSFVIPLKVIGCSLRADEILKEWDLLVKDGFPLIYLSKLLIAIDIKDREQGRFYVLPISMHLIKMIDTIYCARFIDGGDTRINKLKNVLCTLVSSLINKPEMQSQMIGEIMIAILSYSDEFQIGCILHTLYPSLKFNSSNKGPDFMLYDLGIKVEAKSKLNKEYLGYVSNPTILLDKMTCLKLLSKDVFEAGRLEEAFEYQDTDIAIMNVSHSQFGVLFAAYAYGLDNLNLNLSEAFREAIKIARSKDKAVVLYTEQLSYEQQYSICAIASDKNTIENYGSRLDKIEKDHGIDTKTKDGYL